MTLADDVVVTTMDRASTTTTNSVSFSLLSSFSSFSECHCIMAVFFHADSDLWAKYKPLPVEIKTGSVYDYYDVFEEIGV